MPEEATELGWPALLARFQTLVYRPLDAVALASIVRIKLAKVAQRLRRQHEVELSCDESLIDAMAELCLARELRVRQAPHGAEEAETDVFGLELLEEGAVRGFVLGSDRTGE